MSDTTTPDPIVVDDLRLRAEGGPASLTRPTLTNGVLTLVSAPKADLFLDPANARAAGVTPTGAHTPPTAERFVDDVEGDFQLRAYVEVDFRSDFDSGVLLGFVDDATWFKICAELDPDGTRRVVSVVTRDGASDDTNSWPIPGDGIHLRISRSGETFAMHASENGELWSMIRYFSLGAPAPTTVKVGILAQSPTGEGTAARFSQLAFARRSPGPVRSGA